MREPREVAAIEASLRRFACPVAHQSLMQQTLAQVRQRLYEVTVEQDIAWCRTPPRGYTSYVEQCAARGRTSAKAASSDGIGDEESTVHKVNPEVEDSTHETIPSDTNLLIQSLEQPDRDGSEQVDEEPQFLPEPASGVQGVLWHRGMESWEVRVEAHGYKLLGGYFKPRDNTAAAIEQALAAALEQRRMMLESPPSRRHTPY